MTAEVIETARRPPIWSVKAKKRYKAAFTGHATRAMTGRHPITHHRAPLYVGILPSNRIGMVHSIALGPMAIWLAQEGSIVLRYHN
jgi:hypothetical protein